MVLSFSIQFAVHELRDLGEAEPYRGFEIFFIGHFSTERTPDYRDVFFRKRTSWCPM